jgi:hypothetical protein
LATLLQDQGGQKAGEKLAVFSGCFENFGKVRNFGSIFCTCLRDELLMKFIVKMGEVEMDNKKQYLQ